MMVKIKVQSGKGNAGIKPGGEFGKTDYTISLTEEREKGRANKELVTFLATVTGKPVRIVAGHTKTTKLVEIEGDEDEIRGKLDKACETTK